MSVRDSTPKPRRQGIPATGISEQMSAMSITGSGGNEATPSSSAGMTGPARPPKVSTPETFDGTPGRLEAFQLQVQLYFYFNQAQFQDEPDKVLYAASFLRGRAGKGFRPYLKDWLDTRNGGNPKTETRKIFHDYDEFEIKLNDLYGISNEESHADRHIRRLRQTTSVATYASEFQGYAADLEWNDAAFRSQFYLGLKDTVKMELSRNANIRTLAAMINAAKEIDERLQELRQDRFFYPGFKNQQKGKYDEDPYGPRPMELGNITKRGRSQKRSGVRCYRCQEEGHIARNCQMNKVRKELNLTDRITYQECEDFLTENS
jgi:hypothetical protein